MINSTVSRRRFARIHCPECDRVIAENWLIRHLREVHGYELEAGRLSPWQKIVRAAEAGVGLRLSADEVSSLATDDAIRTVAHNDTVYPHHWQESR